MAPFDGTMLNARTSYAPHARLSVCDLCAQDGRERLSRGLDRLLLTPRTGSRAHECLISNQDHACESQPARVC